MAFISPVRHTRKKAGKVVAFIATSDANIALGESSVAMQHGCIRKEARHNTTGDDPGKAETTTFKTRDLVMKKFFSAAAAAIAIAIAATPPAMADDVEVSVSHAGLNLTNAADVAEMEQRIDTAVAAACADVANLNDRSACVSTLKTRALAQLRHRVRLAAAYTGMRSR
jgi:UrcA family protein